MISGLKFFQVCAFLLWAFQVDYALLLKVVQSLNGIDFVVHFKSTDEQSLHFDSRAQEIHMENGKFTTCC